MKIGPLDIRVHALVYLGAIFALIIVMLALWRSNSVGRMETVYRASIMQALIEESKNTPFLDEAADKCRSLIKVTPEKISPRLYLGTILLREEGKAAEALSVLNEIEKMGQATADEKTMAQLCAGVAQFRSVCGNDPEKYAEAAAKCEAAFQRILEKNPTNPDALANLALAKALQNPKAFDAIKTLAGQALAAPKPPSLASTEQLYCLRASIAFNESRPLDALTEYQ